MTRYLVAIVLFALTHTSCGSSNIEVKANSLDTVKAKIITLRKYGFFERYFWSSDEELIDSLYEARIADYSKIYGRFVDPGMRLEDYQILALDKERSVFGTSKTDVFEGRYVEIINAFANASMHLFRPTDVQEKWESENGPVTVSFTHKGEKVTFQPADNNQWVSDVVFEKVNEQLKKRSVQKFYRFLGKDGAGLGQYFLFVRLNENQKDSLQKTFHWKFSE